MIPGCDRLIPLVCLSFFENLRQAVFRRKRQDLGEDVLSDKMGTFVHVVVNSMERTN